MFKRFVTTLVLFLAGGMEKQKKWIVDEGRSFVQVPFPDGFRQRDISFDIFLEALDEQNVNPHDVCGVMSETYQGCNAVIMPGEYAQSLRSWCDKHDALLIFDEVQAGFGRTGESFGFQHLGIVPDLAACGKGISGGMPLSAVIGTKELMDMYGPGEMTSTHSANPVCCAAALANLRVIKDEELVENSASLAPVLAEGLETMARASAGRIGFWAATGLVGAVQFTYMDSTDPDPEPAWELVRRAIEQGVLLFAPVGVGGCAVKINPPLTIKEDALREGLGVLEEITASLSTVQVAG